MQKEDEVLDDLQLDGLMILQKKDGYKFSTDSVLLANFAVAKRNDKVVDFCSGSGVVGILMQKKCNLKDVTLVEIQSELAEMSQRSIELNSQKINVLNKNIDETVEILGRESVDVITINPPYHNSGEVSQNSQIAIAMHEIKTNISHFCLVASKLLKFGGKIYIVHRSDRLAELVYELKSNKLEPKVLQIVYPKKEKEPNLVLVEAKKGASCGLVIKKPLILMNDDGTETEELKKIYDRR